MEGNWSSWRKSLCCEMVLILLDLRNTLLIAHNTESSNKISRKQNYNDSVQKPSVSEQISYLPYKNYLFSLFSICIFPPGYLHPTSNNPMSSSLRNHWSTTSSCIEVEPEKLIKIFKLKCFVDWTCSLDQRYIFGTCHNQCMVQTKKQVLQLGIHF